MKGLHFISLVLQTEPGVYFFFNGKNWQELSEPGQLERNQLIVPEPDESAPEKRPNLNSRPEP